MTRRDLLGGAVGLSLASGLRAHDGIHSVFNGVLVGSQSYSFRDRSLDDAVKAFHQIGIGECELWSNHIENLPGMKQRSREDLRNFRLNVDLAEYEKVRDKFTEAGVEIYAFNYSFRDDFTDAEIERGFEMAKALGAKVITASSNVTTAKRVDPFAKKHDMLVGVHNHSRIRENEFATPDDFVRARKGTTHIAINLDIGHFVGAGFDPVDYISKHHDDIVTLHIKDKTKDDENVVFGQGDTPIVETLHLLRDKKFRIPANIEYEYEGADTIAEVTKCFEYCKHALES